MARLRPYCERLSALDASFLAIEEPNARWHEGAVMVFEADPRAEGGVDARRIARAYEACLDRVERYRQRLAFVPLLNHPVWVDDPSFDVRYHVRHISLPRPGDEATLKGVCGHLLSQPLDLGKPLWEVWIVDGLDDGGFALVTKIHHCMVDGASGMSVLAALLSPDPEAPTPEPRPWKARPVPGGAQLLAGEVRHRARAPLEILRPLRRPRQALAAARDVAVGIVEASLLGWKGVSDTVFNPEQIGPHRRFDWTSLPLAEVKEVKNQLGGTVNDVVLAVAAGALGEFLRVRRTEMQGIDFRALLPVSVRSETETRRLGNRVAMMMAQLPVGERDPRERYRRVVEATGRLKRSRQAVGVRWLEEFADSVGGRFFVDIVRMATRARPFNVAITNVPGPPMPLYLAGARLRGIYPMVPLFSNQALGIAAVSYAGHIYWGFNSDWDTLPDVHDLVEAVSVDFEAVRKAAARGAVVGGATEGMRREA